MENEIKLKDLDCYKALSESEREQLKINPDRHFDLSKLSNEELSAEIKDFIYDRGKKLTVKSIKSEFYQYNLFCDFVNDVFPNIQTLKNIDLEVLIKKGKAWLLRNGMNISQQRVRTDTGKVQVMDSELVKYIRKIHRFLNYEKEGFDFDSDKWILSDIGIEIKDNPANRIKSISFKKIKQYQIKEEIKKIIHIHLSTSALGTVVAEITAINRFTGFLSERFSDIFSLNDLSRDVIEEYLVHTNIEADGRKSYSKDLYHLKSVLITAGKVLGNREIENLFYADDIGKAPEKLYRTYSDSETKRLNEAIVEMDEQIARALFIHQLLGTRISDALTIRKDSIRINEEGVMFLKIRQVKSRKSYEKVINDEIKMLFDKACEYTEHKYGNTKYVFVNDANPNEPMQYSRIKYQLMVMIRKKDLRDDHGERFGVGTHIWRHSYGKRLTELNIDDVTIAKLLGHANTSNLKYYRKVGNEMLSKETKSMRNSMDEILMGIINGW